MTDPDATHNVRTRQGRLFHIVRGPLLPTAPALCGFEPSGGPRGLWAEERTASTGPDVIRRCRVCVERVLRRRP